MYAFDFQADDDRPYDCPVCRKLNDEKRAKHTEQLLEKVKQASEILGLEINIKHV